MAFYAVTSLVALALLVALVALAAAVVGWGQPRPGVLRAGLAVGAAVWASHYAEMWRPVNWEHAATHLTAWPGGLAFALAAPAVAAVAYGLAWRLAPRRPVLAALVPLAWHVSYRWYLVQVITWGLPGDAFVDDDPAGMWLFLRTFVLTGALVCYAVAVKVRRSRAALRPA